MTQTDQTAVLVLEDGRVFTGTPFGAVGETVAKGAELGVLEAMKMQHVLLAQAAGHVLQLLAEPGSYVAQDQALLVLAPAQGDAAHAGVQPCANLRDGSQRLRLAPRGRHQLQPWRKLVCQRAGRKPLRQRLRALEQRSLPILRPGSIERLHQR